MKHLLVVLFFLSLAGLLFLGAGIIIGLIGGGLLYKGIEVIGFISFAIFNIILWKLISKLDEKERVKDIKAGLILDDYLDLRKENWICSKCGRENTIWVSTCEKCDKIISDSILPEIQKILKT